MVVTHQLLQTGRLGICVFDCTYVLFDYQKISNTVCLPTIFRNILPQSLRGTDAKAFLKFLQPYIKHKVIFVYISNFSLATNKFDIFSHVCGTF